MTTAAIAALSILAPSDIRGQDPAKNPPSAGPAKLAPANVTVGQNLQTTTSVALREAAPSAGLAVTLTSSDPNKMLLSLKPDTAGSASIVVTANSGANFTPEFYVQGLGASGKVTYTASAPGFGINTGTVTLSPAGFIITERSRLGRTSFLTTTGAAKSEIRVHSVMLDSALAIVTQQAVAGGAPVKLSLSNSNPAVGTLAGPTVTIDGGADSAALMFQPLSPGSTTLAVAAPKGLSTPALYTAVTANVKMPGMALSDDISIGKNLEVNGTVTLGLPAPAGGVVVTITSNDPSKLLLSAKDTEVGSAEVKVHIPAGSLAAPYWMQSLVEKGTATYMASAPGYESRTGTADFAPSGVVVIGISFPEHGTLAEPGFTIRMSSGPTLLTVALVRLDPVSKRSGDVTVQALRAGLSLTVDVNNDNPSIGKMIPSASFTGGCSAISTYFTPVKTGTAVISVTTPPGYTKSANNTWATVQVID